MEKEYLRNAADAVTEQAFEHPGFGIPVDPDVAEHMGAFTEDAIALADMIDDTLLNIEGEVETEYEER